MLKRLKKGKEIGNENDFVDLWSISENSTKLRRSLLLDITFTEREESSS